MASPEALELRDTAGVRVSGLSRWGETLRAADLRAGGLCLVHIGNGLLICANKWTWVNQAKTDSMFAREVARCLWQPHELVGRSVTGKVCMRKLKEGGEAKPALTPEKLGALRKSYEHFVAKHPSAVDTEARRLKDFNKHLATMLRDAK
ncbi:BEN domain-containing protein 5-like [Dermacentor albipictus]|uniref:BEN domain-containing protein 5-like n=1 Tax=Dermacentor albipictus TaxID=60249 RepID=UPI0038FBEB89